MPNIPSEERVKLCVARSLGLAENLNDAVVLIDSLASTGVIDIEIPEHSMMKSITGEQFVRNLTKAVIQFQDSGDWIDRTYEEVEKAGGVIDDIRGQATIFYRIANEDGSIPAPPALKSKGDRVVVFHP